MIGAGTSEGAGGGAITSAGVGAGGAAGSSSISAAGGAGSSLVSSAAGSSSSAGVGGGTGIGGASEGGMIENESPLRKLTIIPKPGEDPQILARALVWKVGGAQASKLFCYIADSVSG